jgi:hypothetical protein
MEYDRTMGDCAPLERPETTLESRLSLRQPFCSKRALTRLALETVMSSVKHPVRCSGLRALAVLALSSVVSSPLVARAQEAAAPATESSTPDPVLECLGNHTEGQKLRRDGKLIESRDEFRQCSATACPSEIIRDCLGWMEEVDKQIPSVSFGVTANGVTRADVQVFIDDALVLDQLSGRAISVNPGPHRVRVVLAPFAPFEQELVFSEGDRFRMVNVEFASPRARDPLAPPNAARPEVEKSRPVPVATYVFGGLGIAAAISGGAWGISNVALRSEMEDECAPDCSDRSIDVLKQRALIADISWGVSIVSLATAATIYFLRPDESPEQPVAVDVRLLPAGALGTISVSHF